MKELVDDMENFFTMPYAGIFQGQSFCAAVMKAVEQDRSALQWASIDSLANCAVVMKAIKQEGEALQWAS